MKQWQFYPGLDTLEAGWSGKGCGGAGEGLWLEAAECAVSNSRAPGCLLRRHRAALAGPHHSGHGRRELQWG